MTEENCDNNVNPREWCLRDFEAWSEKVEMNGQQLIVLADANQSLHDRTDAYNLCDTIAKCLMVSAMEAKHSGASVRLVDRGTKTIDHLLLRGINDIDIHRAGQLPFGLGFHTNHRGAFVDVDRDQILELCM